MICPKCETKTRVRNTRRKIGDEREVTHRYYRCLSCGFRWRTEEWIAKHLKDLPGAFEDPLHLK